jgi:hypothetical protein
VGWLFRKKRQRREHGSASDSLTERIQNRSPLAIVYLLATSISAATIITAGAIQAVHWHREHFEWQQAAYSILGSLQAGYSFEYFKSELGPPIISRLVTKGYTESVFKERGYFVETLTKGSPEVDYFETTVCDASLTPTFNPAQGYKIVLNRSTFASIAPSPDYDYSFGGFGLTQPPIMREYQYGALQGSYRTFMWGMNPACSLSGGVVAEISKLEHHLPVNGKPSAAQLRYIRSRAVPNEYGVTAPDVHISDLPADNLGIDLVTVSLGSPLNFGPEKSRVSPTSSPEACVPSGSQIGATSIPPCGGF